MGAKGFGLVAARPFAKGDLITPIVSKDVYCPNLNKLFERFSKDEAKTVAEIEVINEYAYGGGSNGNTWMPKDITKAGWWSINHSCNPNSNLSGKGGVRAEKDIQAGEEITCSYGWLKSKKIPCHCGEEFCATIMCPHFEKMKVGDKFGVMLDRESIKLIIEAAHKYNQCGVVGSIPDQCERIFGMPPTQCWEVIFNECNIPDATLYWLYSHNRRYKPLTNNLPELYQ
jgi:hypothetical protein